MNITKFCDPITMQIPSLLFHQHCRQCSTSRAVGTRRWLPGPWMTRELIPNSPPVLIIDFNELVKSSRLKHSGVLPISSFTGSSDTNRRTPLDLVTNYRQVASYSWIGNSSDPVMIIPGSPRRFRTWWTGGTLIRDSGDRLITCDSYMFPDYPMEPAFVAVQKCAELSNLPLPNFHSYDVITDRSNLLRLFMFCSRRGRLSDCDRDRGVELASCGIRMDVERLGERLIVLRRREPTLAVLSNSHKAVYGHDFRSRITEDSPIFTELLSNPLLPKSSSLGAWTELNRHVHMVSYRFNQLHLLVRYSLDSIHPEKSQLVPILPNDKAPLGPYSIPGSRLRYVTAGDGGLYHTVELTSKRRGTFFPRHIWPKMYFGQTNSVVVGWHRATGDGARHVVPKVYTMEECRVLATTPTPVMDPFHDHTFALVYQLLERIVNFVRCQPSDKKYAILWQEDCPGQLRVYEKTNASRAALPPYLVSEVG